MTVTRITPASQHPDPMVRRAENFGLVLKTMVEDMKNGKITPEIFGHSYQKFCIDEFRKIQNEEREQCAKELEVKLLDGGERKTPNEIRFEAAERLRYVGRLRAHMALGNKASEFKG